MGWHKNLQDTVILEMFRFFTGETYQTWITVAIDLLSLFKTTHLADR